MEYLEALTKLITEDRQKNREAVQERLSAEDKKRTVEREASDKQRQDERKRIRASIRDSIKQAITDGAIPGRISDYSLSVLWMNCFSTDIRFIKVKSKLILDVPYEIYRLDPDKYSDIYEVIQKIRPYLKPFDSLNDYDVVGSKKMT